VLPKKERKVVKCLTLENPRQQSCESNQLDVGPTIHIRSSQRIAFVPVGFAVFLAAIRCMTPGVPATDARKRHEILAGSGEDAAAKNMLQ
jgi:hypothetical protein